jgi:hypothetical protein
MKSLVSLPDVKDQFTILLGASADVPEHLVVKPWPVCGDDPRHGYPQPMYVGVTSAELFTQLPMVSVL